MTRLAIALVAFVLLVGQPAELLARGGMGHGHGLESGRIRKFGRDPEVGVSRRSSSRDRGERNGVDLRGNPEVGVIGRGTSRNQDAHAVHDLHDAPEVGVVSRSSSRGLRERVDRNSLGDRSRGEFAGETIDRPSASQLQTYLGIAPAGDGNVRQNVRYLTGSSVIANMATWVQTGHPARSAVNWARSDPDGGQVRDQADSSVLGSLAQWIRSIPSEVRTNEPARNPAGWFPIVGDVEALAENSVVANLASWVRTTEPVRSSAKSVKTNEPVRNPAGWFPIVGDVETLAENSVFANLASWVHTTEPVRSGAKWVKTNEPVRNPAGWFPIVGDVEALAANSVVADLASWIHAVGVNAANWIRSEPAGGRLREDVRDAAEHSPDAHKADWAHTHLSGDMEKTSGSEGIAPAGSREEE